ncbi:MAG: XrtA-associated tyrosine autokinase [Usitatibacteraceae bacterium]
MSVIEQAAKRLEELRRAGIGVPAHAAPTENSSRSHLGDESGFLPTQPGPETNVTAGRAPATSSLSSPLMPDFEIDLSRLAAGGFVTPDMPRSRIADEFRIVKRPLIANAYAKGKAGIKNGNLIMVTSAMPGEGKTFSSVNLAMSLAMEMDRTVLLVDADVARPSLPQVLGLPPTRGLLDALDEKLLDISELLSRTNVEKLTILTSGTQHPQATELLASDAMVNLLEALVTSDPDRIVIFDSPPLLVTTESRVLASQMGQIVFVVKAESTLQSDVKKALATIEACPVKTILLNQARTVAQGAYGYGYGYK